MKIRLVLVTLGLLGLIVAMALLLSQARQDTLRFEAWPPTVWCTVAVASSAWLTVIVRWMMRG